MRVTSRGVARAIVGLQVLAVAAALVLGAPAAPVALGTAALWVLAARREPRRTEPHRSGNGAALPWWLLAGAHVLAALTGSAVALYCLLVVTATALTARAGIGRWRTAPWADAATVLLGSLALGGMLRSGGVLGSDATLLVTAALIMAISTLAGWRPGPTLWWISASTVALAVGTPALQVLGWLGMGLAAQPFERAPVVTDRRRAVAVGRRAAALGRRLSDVPLFFTLTSAGVLVLELWRPAGLSGPVGLAALGALCLAAFRSPTRWRGPVGAGQGTDELTGLANRKALAESLATDGAAPHSLEPAAAEPWSGWTDRIAMLLIDLDRFKEINEAFGHEVGDQVLAQVGTRLRGVLRPNQVLARLGGDEFAVVLPGAGGQPARRVAETLRAQLDEPVEVDTAAGVHAVYVQASVGIATCRLPRGNPQDLLRQADIAVYEAKQKGTGIEQFDAGHDHGAQRLLRIGELRSALEHGDLEVFLQPQVDLASGAVCGAEALARWRHPKDGVLLPAAFLPLAAQTGLMRPVAAIVLDLALSACARWWRPGLMIPVSVNLTGDDLVDPDLTDRIPGCLAAYGLPPAALRIEVTEDVLLNDTVRVAELLAGWHALGVSVSLDDYGTGYSSLAHLRELPVDELKLDRVFVADIENTRTATIVRHTVAMAHGLGMTVVAEGVESAAAAAALTRAGCDVGQGLHYGAAMDLPSFLSHVHGG